jgi:ribosome-associated heat shock protein Hsp15
LDRQRIDKWLWHARVVRTRSAAASLVGSGMVRLNSERVEQPSRPVRPGDVVTVALDRQVRILKVTGYAERRGSADVARGLFEDLTPPAPPKPRVPASAERDEGAGRPTKRDRRETDRLRGRDGFDLE